MTTLAQASKMYDELIQNGNAETLRRISENFNYLYLDEFNEKILEKINARIIELEAIAPFEVEFSI